MYKDGSGRTLVNILFSRRREVDGFPWLKGGEEIGVPAKRNRSTGRLSAMLAKSVIVMLKGAVVGVSQLAEGGVMVRSLSQVWIPMVTDGQMQKRLLQAQTPLTQQVRH